MNSVRDLPSVDEVLRKLGPVDGLPHDVVANEVRAVLADWRAAIRLGAALEENSIQNDLDRRLAGILQPSLRRVINATGIVLHTNLGRAPLPEFTPLEGYSNLEYDIATGRRGKREGHIAPLLERLLGAPGLAVNNNAAAVFLVLNEFAAGQEVLVSRGELIEIGDGFRIPEIMTRSGAMLREVGTTNRTSIEDYRRAINERTRLILRVHPSNFRISGFTSRPTLAELIQLGRDRNLPVYEDLGSGCLVDLRPAELDEPLVSDSLKAGVNLVSFSGDKLLGGPQSGIIAGENVMVQRVRRNPLYRAFRVDKLTIQSLQMALLRLLRQDWDAIPALKMIFTPLEKLEERARSIAAALGEIPCSVCEARSAIGGGSTPDQTIPSWVVTIDIADANAFAQRLRGGGIPVIARTEHDKVILDVRTIMDGEEPELIKAVQDAFH